LDDPRNAPLFGRPLAIHASDSANSIRERSLLAFSQIRVKIARFFRWLVRVVSRDDKARERQAGFLGVVLIRDPTGKAD